MTRSLFLASDGLGALKRYRTAGIRRVLFVPTGAEVVSDASFVARDRRALQSLGFELQDLQLSGRNRRVNASIAWADAVFVGGGSVYYLLEHAWRTGFAEQVIRATERGKPYFGVSGGAIIASRDLRPWRELTSEPMNERRGELRPLGLTDVLVLPHAADRWARYAPTIRDWADRVPIVPLRDDEALIVKNDRWEKVGSLPPD